MSINLDNDIAKALSDYTTDVEKALDEAARKIALSGAKELKKTSPKRKKNGGKYARSWGVQKQKDKQIIRNKKHYQLTHLLEFGHATRDGGRTRALPHIASVEERVNKDYEEEVKRQIKKGV